ncbi:MAG: DUF262 domain-containing protein [Verrucomicrobiaceae bacterium]|nr:DUF262 domain-containing protein [Verrucomicrobiaceae bacterium]
MSYLPQSLFRITEQINQTLLLPHIQRPFVWDEEQMIRLFDSLMRNFPVQTILLWKTKDEIRVRRFMGAIDWDAELHKLYDLDKSSLGVEKTLVLDGQQRIQSLYAIFRGGIGASDEDLRVAYFDITSGLPSDGEDIRYKLVFAKESPGQQFYRVRDLMESDRERNAEDISERLNDALDAANGQDKERERRVRKNVSQLISLLREDRHFYAQTLDGVACPADYPYSNILNIFVRVNSGGTKLSPADLMFAAMKTDFTDVEENIEDTVEMLSSTQLPFERDFVLKCLLTALNRGAGVDVHRLRSPEFITELRTKWAAAEAAFEQLTDFLVQDLRVISPRIISSFNSLVPLFDYLFHHPKPGPTDRARMKAYFYRAQILGWFGSSTDSVINRMHLFVAKGEGHAFPLRDISSSFGWDENQTIISDERLQTPKLRPLFLNLVYVEKFGASPFQVRYKDNEPQIDHIFPQSPLRTKLSLRSAEINHLGNLRFIGARDNLRKRAELPSTYFKRLKLEGVPIEKHLLAEEFITNPDRLQFDLPTYGRFLTARFAIIKQSVQSVVNV